LIVAWLLADNDCKTLKIGLDLINLRGLQDGVGRLTRQLLEGFSLFDNRNEYFLFLTRDICDNIHLDPQQFHQNVIDVPKSRLIPRNQLYFSLHSLFLPPLDLLHSPVSVAPLALLRPIKNIVTVVDLAFKRHPEASAPLTRNWQKIAWPICLKKASHIVAISESTKNDILSIYRVPAEKVSVVYPHVSIVPKLFSQADIRKIRELYQVPDRYILHVGAPHKRKNLLGLIKAFHLFKKKQPSTHKLLLVGPQWWERESLEDEIRRNNLVGEVVFSGYIPDEEMSYIYSSADLFVFPSFYEGFGYPPLEAMACGTPAIVSNKPSLPEIVGPAALLVDPFDPQDIADKMAMVMSSAQLRNKLIALGLECVKFFSSEKMAKGYLEVYEKIFVDHQMDNQNTA
jgi:glycosyltransferase involved in cell wall biosynthesis